MKPINRLAVILTGITVLLGLTLNAGAQDVKSSDMQILVEKLRADKKLFVSENMQLTESEAKAFWPVYSEYQDKLIALRARTARLIKDYADSYLSMTNDKAKTLMDEYMAIESAMPGLRQEYLPKFRKVLPEAKVVRYYQIESKINALLAYELAAAIPLMEDGN